MTVQELIYKLAQCPPDAEVFVEHDGVGVYGPFEDEEPVSIVHKESVGNFNSETNEFQEKWKVYILHDRHHQHIRNT